MEGKQQQRHHLNARYHNTLHGFQYLGSDTDAGTAGFVACRYQDGNEQRTNQQLYEEMLKQAKFWDGNEPVTSDRAWMKDFLGCDYVCVRNRSDAPAVINALLALGCVYVKPASKLAPRYTPADAPFSIETSERLILELIQSNIRVRDGREMSVGDMSWLRPECTLDERLWKTEAGKELAREQLRRYPWERERFEIGEPLFIPYGRGASYDPAIDWPPVDGAPVPAAAAPPVVITIEDDPQPEKRKKRPEPSVNEEVLDCMVCMDRKADTLVLPCQHSVACKPCSDKLRNTPNAHVCIMCRQPITDVLTDG